MSQQSPDEELLQEIHRQLKDLTEKVESAFLKDDYGDTDYVGHRAQHKKQKDNDEEYQKSKIAIIRNIISWLTIGLLTIVGSSLAQIYLLSPNK